MNIWVVGGLKGIGKSIVEKHIDSGDSVWVSSRTPVATSEKLKHVVFYGDLTSEQVVREHVTKLLNMTQRIHAIYLCHHFPNNPEIKNFESVNWSNYIQQFEGTMRPSVNVVHEIIRNVAVFKDSAILCFSSFTVATGYGGNLVARNVSKAALECFVKCASHELGLNGIRINALSVGWTQTPQLEKYIQAGGSLDISSISLGRIAQAREIADTAIFLCSPSSSYITGTIFPVSGGISPKLR